MFRIIRDTGFQGFKLLSILLSSDSSKSSSKKADGMRRGSLVPPAILARLVTYHPSLAIPLSFGAVIEAARVFEVVTLPVTDFVIAIGITSGTQVKRISEQ